MHISAPAFIISILLFMVLFFGMAFIVNMLIKTTWVPVILYPVIIILYIDEISIVSYITDAGDAFAQLGGLLTSLAPADIIVLSGGWLGTVIAGSVIRLLRVKNYQMF